MASTSAPGTTVVGRARVAAASDKYYAIMFNIRADAVGYVAGYVAEAKADADADLIRNITFDLGIVFSDDTDAKETCVVDIIALLLAAQNMDLTNLQPKVPEWVQTHIAAITCTTDFIQFLICFLRIGGGSDMKDPAARLTGLIAALAKIVLRISQDGHPL
jgi:hypothetical protein